MTDGALSDLRVIEFADFISGPFCAKLMADLGAEVIKIETPSSGDTARQTGPFPNDIAHPERSGLFLYLNTNKQSITLDPGTSAGADIFKELVKSADVLIENMPPSTMEGLGLDYESLRRINPGLIMTSITPFGQSGPYAHRKANDLICTQMSGLAYHTPSGGVDSPERPPLKPGGRQSDFIAGSTAAAATMFAVIARRTLGEGQHLDVSQHESNASFLRPQVAFHTYDPGEEAPLGRFDTSAR
ncbi:MAG: CoA transferase, partial [Desulfobacterales bacterium]